MKKTQKNSSHVSRNGTFLGSDDGISSTMTDQLKGLLEEALKKESHQSERLSVVEALYHDLDLKKFSSDIQEEQSLDLEKQHSFSLTQQEIDWMDRHDESSWLNYLIYRYQFKIYPKAGKLRNFPLHLLVEPTSVCNLRCVMCFQVDKSFTTKKHMGFIPWDLFTDVMDQAKEHHCHAVTMASRGEPTVYKDFGKMLRYAGELGIMDLKINTNATRLTEELCHDIFSSEVSEVVFSVDAGTKETYEKIRVLGKFDQVVQNIERFNDIRAKHYPQCPTVTRISGVLVRDDQDIEQMTSFWNQRVDEVTIKSAAPRWDSYNNSPQGVTAPCSLLWERMYVWHDGQVNPCDFDYKSYLSVGNVREKALTELWQGEAYEKLRRDHLQKRRDDRVPCDRCPLY